VRAVRLLEAHHLELVELPVPEAVPGEVVIRVDGCGICGSDLTSYKVGLFTDSVPGHEIAGVVESVGDGVKEYANGGTTACAETAKLVVDKIAAANPPAFLR